MGRGKVPTPLAALKAEINEKSAELSDQALRVRELLDGEDWRLAVLALAEVKAVADHLGRRCAQVGNRIDEHRGIDE